MAIFIINILNYKISLDKFPFHGRFSTYCSKGAPSSQTGTEVNFDECNLKC